MTGFYNWSTTPASNATVGNIDWAEGMAPSQVNNSARQQMADVAAWRDFLSGAKTTSGTDTITLTSGMTITAYAAGQMFVAKLGGTNTGAATLNVDSLGAKAVEINGAAVSAGALVSGKYYLFIYDGTAFQVERLSGAVQNSPVDDVTLQDTGSLIQIKALGVNTAQLAASAVETAKINDAAVTTDKINDAAVTTDKINDDAVTPTKVAGAINAQTGTTYTAVLTDDHKVVTMSNASANTLTIPTNASVAFPVGAKVSIGVLGAGVTTVTGDTGVTVNGVSAGSGALAQYGACDIVKTATDTWWAVGLTVS